MSTPLLSLVLLALLPADLPAQSATSRRPNPLAPSLPLLTDDEEQRFDEIVDRFIRYDLGKLPGAAGKQALNDFKRLGPEAIFALIRGINRAANIEGSCPALVIGKKIESILWATSDVELLEFARENIGAGVTQSRHQGYLRDLRIKCLLWKRSAARRPPAAEPREVYIIRPTSPMTPAERAKGARLKTVRREPGKRQEKELARAPAKTAAPGKQETRQRAGELLDSFIAKQKPEFIKRRLQDERPHMRALAARLVGEKEIPCYRELIDLLSDAEPDVRQAARTALKRLSHGVDFGPGPEESAGGQAEAQGKWRMWLAQQGGPR